MQAQIIMLIPILMNTTTLHNAQSVLKRYQATRSETVAVLPADISCAAKQSNSDSTIVCDESLRKASESSKDLPGESKTDNPPADLPDTKDGAGSDPSHATKQVMPTPTQLVRTRTGCVTKALWLPENATSAVEEKPQDPHRRPHASVYGESGPRALAAKTPGKRPSLKRYILEHLQPEVFDETSVRSGKNERRVHRLPGEQPADAPIPDSTQ